MSFLDELNESQRAAVEYNDGAQLIVAGAGSGKTRVLTYKIAYLLAQGVSAGHILALTFTNKAAREMKQRICHLVGEDVARYIWMGTFHSICARILRKHATTIGFTRDYTIYDASDQKSLVKKIIKDLKLDDKIYKPGTIIDRISTAKSAFVSPEEYAQSKQFAQADSVMNISRMPQIYAEYDKRLHGSNAMDFDDLLMYTVILLQNNADIREQYQSWFWYVLVDEYQDTNRTQYLLVKLFAEPQNKVCVVGDDAQSIYSFRGATIENILGFQQAYADARLFKLERNYRSTQTIVNTANSLIYKNKAQIRKNVYSEKEVGDKVRVTGYDTDREESHAVAQQIVMLHNLEHRNYEDIAILYRTNAQSRSFEDEIRKRNIPYRIYGGLSFYGRKEIKDAIAYFRLVANERDNEALDRIINMPKRGIGDTTVDKLREAAAMAGQPILAVCREPERFAPLLQAGTRKKVQAFAQMIDELHTLMQEKDAYEYTQAVYERSGLMADAVTDYSPEGIDRRGNLEELLSAIHQFVTDRKAQDEDAHINDFLNEVSLLTDQDERLDDRTPRVTMMTVHAAKGLEFPVVFVVGLEENLFPSPFCETEKEMEEERRLLYVAITRAEQQCFITYANQRWKNGQPTFNAPSRFIRDIDPQYITRGSSVPTMMPPWIEQPRTPRTMMSHPTTRPTEQLRQATVTPPARPATLKAVKQLPKQPMPDAVISEWKEGDRIAHKVFGKGTVKCVYKENDNEKIDIVFDDKGKKTLLLTYAKLERI